MSNSLEQQDKQALMGKPNALDIFVQRPLLAVVISLVLVLLGVRAAMDMPILEFPEIESSSLIITTPYVGASYFTQRVFGFGF